MLDKRYGSALQCLPVTPCAHFTIGGVVIDGECKTSCPGLFVAGEAACGIHGGNRMGGNALTEAIVFGARAGTAAASFVADNGPVRGGYPSIEDLPVIKNCTEGKKEHGKVLAILRQSMWENCGPVRNGGGKSAAIETVEALRREGIRCTRPDLLATCWSVWNSLQTARMMIGDSSTYNKGIDQGGDNSGL